MFRIVLPIVELPCSSPTAKTESLRSSGALPRIVSITNRSSNRPSNSGLKASGPPGSRSWKRNTGNSSPSISWLFSLPPLIERSMRVWSAPSP